MKGVLTVVAALLLLCSVASAEIPQMMGYQGRITENTGIPVANGTYAMQFRIYDAETGGTLLWDSGSLSVETNAGVFSVMLGESPQPSLNLDFDQDCWLLVTYRGEDQLPRKRLGSVGYAYMASGLVPGTEVVGTTSSPVLKGTNLGTGAGLLGHSDQGTGVRGQSSATNGKAVLGKATAVSGVNYGVYGETSSTDGYAGYFAGPARVAGDLTVMSGGKLGIGETAPANPLVIAGAESDSAGEGAQLRIHDSTNSNHAFAVRIGASGNRNLNVDSYWGGWQTLTTVDRETGRVGIGTPTPERKASVIGHVRAANDSAETEFVEIYHGGGNGFVNWNGDGDFEMRYANNPKVTVQQDGSVGIGTTSPGATLDVRGSAVFNEAGGDNDFRVEGDTQPNLLVADASTDRVGLGTATPSAMLDVRGSAVFNEDGGDYDFRVEGLTRQNLLLVDASTDRVGIGTGAPNATLDVRGDAVFNDAGSDYDFRVEGDTEPNLLFIDAGTDRIGIGTASLAAVLDVRAGPRSVGVRGETAASSGWGVYGYATSTANYSVGVHGETTSTEGIGVYGSSPAGRGVSGRVTATTGGTGVYGTSPAGHGVYGEVTTVGGYGVYGTAPGGFGVYGKITSTSEFGIGVRGWSDSYYGAGVEGTSMGTGVKGIVPATTGQTIGVLGDVTSPTGTGVYGHGGGYGVYSSGNFVASGSKSCVVKTSQGPTLLYCQESPESWFEDFGEGQLVGGRCHVELAPLFLETVTIDAANPMKVYVTPNGPMGEWWVEKETSRFTVVASGGPDGTTFDYRVVAKRKGFEDRRLDYCKAAETDSHLYPELRAQQLREFEKHRPRPQAESPGNQAE